MLESDQMLEAMCERCGTPYDLSTKKEGEICGKLFHKPEGDQPDTACQGRIIGTTDDTDTAARRILNFLSSTGAAHTAKVISEHINVPLGTVKVTLTCHSGELWKKNSYGNQKEVYWQKIAERKVLQSTRGIVRLHRRDGKVAISTNAETERDFIDGLATALANSSDNLEADSLARWLPLAVDVACKMRGYKSAAIEKRVIVAGSWLPDEQEHVVSEAGSELQ